MFALILLLTINNQDHRFVLDRNLSAGDCYSQLRHFTNTGNKARGVRVANTYYCEKVR